MEKIKKIEENIIKEISSDWKKKMKQSKTEFLEILGRTFWAWWRKFLQTSKSS